MNKHVIIATVLFILSLFSGIAASSMLGSGTATGTQIGAPPAPSMPVVKQTSNNFTKIEISPRFGNLRLQPGESKEIAVTIKNKDTKAVDIKPNVVIPPYSQYTMEKEWVTVTPDSAELPAGESQKFTIKISAPTDASAGFYNAQIAFTDEVIPTPYPQPVPAYVHSFSLSLNIWTTPKIQILTPSIQDQLEAGKEYDYEVKLKNIGDKAISISPKVGANNNYYIGPYPMTPQALTDDAINITSPLSVPAGATEIVKVHIKVPPDAKGSYNGWIDLGIDDPSIQEFQGRVNLNFNIWKQPTDPFVKTFSLQQDAPVTIEISSNAGYPYPSFAQGAGTGISKEPSFETTIEGPNGKVKPAITKTVIKGSVSMGGTIPPWEIESTGIYREMGTQYAETYTINGTAGEWKLKVLPNNTESFAYTITIGG